MDADTREAEFADDEPVVTDTGATSEDLCELARIDVTEGTTVCTEDAAADD